MTTGATIVRSADSPSSYERAVRMPGRAMAIMTSVAVAGAALAAAATALPRLGALPDAAAPVWALTASVAVVATLGSLTGARRRSLARAAWTAPGVHRGTTGLPVRTSAPTSLTPALGSLLLDGEVCDRDVAATLIDLARRGHLTIDGLWAGASGSATVADDRLLELNTDVDRTGLAHHELAVLDALFDGADVVRLSVDGARWDAATDAARAAVAADARALGLMTRTPAAQRRLATSLGTGLVGLGAAVEAALVLASTSPLWGVPLIVAGVTVALVGAAWPTLTVAGTRARTQASAYRQHLIEQSVSHRLRTVEDSTFTDATVWATALAITPSVAETNGSADAAPWSRAWPVTELAQAVIRFPAGKDDTIDEDIVPLAEMELALLRSEWDRELVHH